MKVLLINCPVREDSVPNLIPLGVGYIASSLKQAGHNVDVWDFNWLRFTKEEVEDLLNCNKKYYDLFCVSGIVTTYSYQKWLIETIRKYSVKPIVCGNGCASVVGNLLLKAGATEVIAGEGENKILKYVNSSLTYNSIDEIPFPDYSSFSMETYLKNPIWGKDTGNSSNVAIHPDMENIKRSVNVITSRGCPFSCKFCYDLFGKNYRQRSVQNVIDEISYLQSKHNIDFVGFVDDNMFVNRNWV